MGVQDFHDLDSPIPEDERTVANSKEKAHVRGIYALVEGEDERTADDRYLQEAIDAFLLSGALKLYRADHGMPDGLFRHHTMLVHEAMGKESHSMTRDLIGRLWKSSGYYGTSGLARLRALYEG